MKNWLGGKMNINDKLLKIYKYRRYHRFLNMFPSFKINVILSEILYITEQDIYDINLRLPSEHKFYMIPNNEYKFIKRNENDTYIFLPLWLINFFTILYMTDKKIKKYPLLKKFYVLMIDEYSLTEYSLECIDDFINYFDVPSGKCFVQGIGFKKIGTFQKWLKNDI